MISTIPPAILFIVGGFLVPFLKGRIKAAYMLLLPVLAFLILLSVDVGTCWTVSFLDYRLILGRVDRLSLVFGYIFTIISFIGFLFALKSDDNLQHVAAFSYAGAALGVTFAGDLISLYVFWEVMAVAFWCTWPGACACSRALFFISREPGPLNFPTSASKGSTPTSSFSVLP